MKAVILAGGFGTRLGEETYLKPKPMVEIGGKPILWHIMKIYSSFNINDFIICLGYKGHIIKEYFANYFLHNSDISIDVKNNKMKFHQNDVEPWTVTLIDTGYNTMTGGRVKRIEKYVENETFCLTYGDGLSNVNILDSISFHKKNKHIVTITAVQPPGRFGALILKDNKITNFQEKAAADTKWINGGFFICEPDLMNYIEGDETILEREPLQKLARDGQLGAYIHTGFWHHVDTMIEKNYLNDLWNNGNAPWKTW
jgi:glucose-1-phosphate cytidylyltransferase